MDTSDTNKLPVRYEYLDVARGISILLIVLGHTGVIGEFRLNFIYYINVPIFFALSGILMEIKNRGSKDCGGMGNYLIKRFRNLMIPYAVFSIIYSVIYFVQMRLGYMNGGDFEENIRRAVDFYGESVLWFLPTLFLAELGFLVVRKIAKGISVYLISFLLGVSAAFSVRALPPGGLGIGPIGDILIDLIVLVLRSLVALCFTAFGAFLYKYILSRVDIGKIKIRLLFAVLGIAVLGLSCWITGLGSKVDLRNMELGNEFLYFVQAILGVGGILGISIAIRKFVPLSFFGRNSLIVMCTHLDCYVMFGAIQVAWLVDTVVTRAKSYIFVLVIMSVVIVAEIIIIFLVNSFLPFLVGKSYKRAKKRRSA